MFDFILRLFTGDGQRRDRENLDRRPINQQDRGNYETLNRNPAPSYNHRPRQATAESGNRIFYGATAESGNRIFYGRNFEIPAVSAQPPPPRVEPSSSQSPWSSSDPPPRPSQFSSNPPSSSQTPWSSSDPPPRPSHKQFSSDPPPSSSQTPSSSSGSPPRPPQFSADPPPSSSRLPPFSSKPTLSPLPSNPTNPQTKASYVWVQTGTSPIYEIPEDFKDLIKKDVVPRVLNKPLSPLTYKDYFAALLYAEDFYVEKWSEFQLKNVTINLHQAEIYKESNKNKKLNACDEKDEKTFVEFEMDSVREKRPFLLSRDFVFARPSDRNVEPFQGIIYRVVKSKLVLVEFGKDFHSQHRSTHTYDVSFSFNRVCLKRAHQAVAAASDPLFQNFLFPDCVSRKSFLTSPPPHYSNCDLDSKQKSAIHQILSLKGPPPYLIEGPVSITKTKQLKYLSRTGLVVREAVLQIYRTFPKCRILISAPINSTCDVMMRSLKEDIPETDMFRANAAFRELDGVPDDILSSCLYKGECFACPSLRELRKFKVILSTFVSSFRLCHEGINSGHFSHIFLVDASSATEPETMVTLANLANEKTIVVLTGAPGNHSGWMRSDIARRNGLMRSYFERLSVSKPYSSLDPTFITQLG